MNKGKYNGFTLVELIIVVTILTILATISFVSFKGYTKSTRDSTRLTTLKNMDTGLQIAYLRTQKYPMPEDNIEIFSSGSFYSYLPQNYNGVFSNGVTIGYQGFFGANISNFIKINKTPLDPLDGKKYTYAVNSKQNSYQLLTFLENSDNLAFEAPSIIQKVNADLIDYSKRYPKTGGNDLGILLGTSGSYLNTPLQEFKSSTFTGIDIKSYNGTLGGVNIGNLKAVFKKESDSISGTGSEIIKIENRYNKKVQMPMTKCPSGRRDLGIFYGEDLGAFVFFRSEPILKLCEGSSGEVPEGTEIIMSKCPTGWTKIGEPGIIDATTLTFWNYSCNSDNDICEMCRKEKTPTKKGDRLIMSSCPVGFIDKGPFTAYDPGTFTNWNTVCEHGDCRVCEKN